MVSDEQHHFQGNLQHERLVSMQHTSQWRDTSRINICVQRPQACNQVATHMPRAWLFHPCFSRRRPVFLT